MACHGRENGQEQENGQMVGKGTSKEMPFLAATHLQCPVGDEDADKDLEGIV